MTKFVAALAGLLASFSASGGEPPPNYRPPPPWADAPPVNIEVPDGTYKSPAARAALKTILRRGVGVALAQTSRGDAFAPIAVVVDATGKDQLVLAEVHVQREAGEVDLLAQRDVLTKNVKRLKPSAAAVFADANVRLPGTPNKTEAVIANFEHADGTCLTVIVPYDRVGGKVKERAPLSMDGDCGESLLR